MGDSLSIRTVSDASVIPGRPKTITYNVRVKGRVMISVLPDGRVATLLERRDGKHTQVVGTPEEMVALMQGLLQDIVNCDLCLTDHLVDSAPSEPRA